MKFPHILCSLFLATSLARAGVTVSDAWIRATVPSQKATGAFMELKADEACKLVSATCPLTKTVEIHEMSMEGDVMKMRQIPSIELPADKAVSLAPGGYHVMLIDLKEQVQPDQKVPITLTIEKPDGKKETLEVMAIVRPLNFNRDKK